MAQMYPNSIHDIPLPSAMNIGKLGSGGAVTSDTSNGARKTRRLLVEIITEAVQEMSNDDVTVNEVDCWNHLRNLWLGGMTKALSRDLNIALKDDLDEIDSHLRINTNIDSILRAVDKEFSLCANYPKGHGELFRE
jgi:hypothetical protein